MRAVPLRSKTGEIIRWFGNSTGICDHKKAERLLEESEHWRRLIMQSVKDLCILTMDTSAIVNSWNPGAEVMFGYTTAEAIGRPGAIIFIKED